MDYPGRYPNHSNPHTGLWSREHQPKWPHFALVLSVFWYSVCSKYKNTQTHTHIHFREPKGCLSSFISGQNLPSFFVLSLTRWGLLQRQEAGKGHIKGTVRLFKCRASTGCIASKTEEKIKRKKKICWNEKLLMCVCVLGEWSKGVLEFEANGRSIYCVSCVCVCVKNSLMPVLKTIRSPGKWHAVLFTCPVALSFSSQGRVQRAS